MNAPASPGTRLVSLDQFRGYTVVGMFLVNYLGSFAVCPRLFRHTHDYISYADTIMPQFLFAVGFAMRLSMRRRMESQGVWGTAWRMTRRLLGLVLVSLVIYTVGRRAENWEALTALGFWGAIGEPLKRNWFQTLMHIAVTSLWLIPVIHRGATARIAWMLASAIAHVILSYLFNFTWVNSPPNGIDGGPLGFLTWTIPAMVGTLACDVFHTGGERLKVRSPAFLRVSIAAIGLMLLGYGFSCGTRFYDVVPMAASGGVNDGQDEAAAVAAVPVPAVPKLAEDPVWPSPERRRAKLGSERPSLLAEPPFVAPPPRDQRQWNYWMMSQRCGSLSYLTFAAGFSLVVYQLFYIACDLWGWRWTIFQTFGSNALLAYVLHDLVSGAIKPFVPNDSPSWYVAASLALFFWVTWLFVRHFEKQAIYLRV